jgi:hypothetical protein
MIFNNSKISRKHVSKTKVLIEVLRNILLDTSTEVSKHKDAYLNKSLVNKERIQNDQIAPRSSIEEVVALRTG